MTEAVPAASAPATTAVPAERTAEESRLLRCALRDIVALSSLPAVWVHLGNEGIARSLADVLFGTLSLDLLYVRLSGDAGAADVEVVRSGTDAQCSAERVRVLLAPLLDAGPADAPLTVPHPSGDGELRIAISRFGGGDFQGVLVAGSRHPEFPGEHERALLGVAANQTAIVVQRRRAEQDLQEQRERLAVTLASIADAVIATDTDGCVTYLNPAAEHLTGWSAGAAAGKPLHRVFPALDEHTREPARDPVECVLVEDGVVRFPQALVLRASDGSEQPVDASAAPIRDGTGTVLGVVVVFRSVAEQRAAEHRLRESEARKGAIVEAALDAIITIDHRGTVVEFNPAAERTFGYASTEVVGRELAGFIIPPALRERHRRGLKRYLAGAASPVLGKRIEVPALHADGSEFPVELAITRIPSEGPPLFTAHLRDISERARSEQYRSVRLAVTQMLAQSTDLQEVAAGVLQTVCDGFGWDAGVFWILDRSADALRCLRVWRSGEVDISGFEAATRIARFQRGHGLPGIAWSRGEPVWIADVASSDVFPRATVAGLAGLHAAFACPLIGSAGTLGVIEFFSRRIREPDPDMLETMATVSGLAGQLIERLLAEEALRDARSRLESALEAGAIVTWTWDMASNRLHADDSLARMFGLPPSAAAGGEVEQYIQAIHPEDRDRVNATLGASLRTGCDYEAEYRIVQPDGSDRWVIARGRPERDQAGVPVRMPGVLVDITDRKRLEEELRLRVQQLARADRRKEELLGSLRESEEKLRLLADTIPQLAWMARPDGHVTWFNRRWYEYTGGTPAQMEGWGWQSAHDPDVLPDVLARWSASIASGEPFEMVFPLKAADGTLRPFLTRVEPLRGRDGRILYWFGTNTDISEIKRMEDALRDADRRKDEFLATLAHELRNPLAPIRNSLQILKMRRMDTATAEKIRQIMERQVHHLVRLVDDLLDVSRVMRGKIELRREPVELANVIARAVETAQPLIEVQGHELDISVPPDSLLLDADPVRVAQVVANLLTNAAKYTEAGGHIELAAERDGAHAVLRVRDDGIGIEPDMLPHVFGLFVQVDHGTTRSQGGLGIGLTLVRNLVELHGGSVEARSDGLGRGSTFLVRLPLMRQPAHAPEEPGDEPQAAPAAGCRVLVVDDNADAADSLAMMLRMQGHEVHVEHDGAAAIRTARRFRPRLVLLDIGMPGMDGFEVVRSLRAIPDLRDTVVAALTGWGQQEDRRRTAEAGFDHHLVKPIEPAALQRLMADLEPQAPSSPRPLQ